MLPYDVFLHLDLLESVRGNGGQRRQMMEFIRRLRDHPNTPGDFVDKDAAQRERQVKIIGEYALVYWVDDAARAVMIVDVRPADH